MTTRLTIVAILGILGDYQEGHSSEEETLEAIRHQIAEPPPTHPAPPQAEKPAKKAAKRKGGWSEEAKTKQRERIEKMNAARAAKKAERDAQRTPEDPPEVLELARDMFRNQHPELLAQGDIENHPYWPTCLEEARKELS